MKVTIKVDRDACNGTALCQAMAPTLFRLTAAGHAVATVAEVTDPAEIEKLTDVAECCPTEAIVLAGVENQT